MQALRWPRRGWANLTPSVEMSIILHWSSRVRRQLKAKGLDVLLVIYRVPVQPEEYARCHLQNTDARPQLHVPTTHESSASTSSIHMPTPCTNARIHNSAVRRSPKGQICHRLSSTATCSQSGCFSPREDRQGHPVRPTSMPGSPAPLESYLLLRPGQRHGRVSPGVCERCREGDEKLAIGEADQEDRNPSGLPCTD